MKKWTVILLPLFLAQPVLADIYKWKDERGTINFTEDFGKVPAKYRKKVTIIPEGAPAGPEVTETVVDTKAKQKKDGVNDAKDGASSRQEKKSVYGGKDGDSWKAEFASLKNEIKNLEERLGENKAKLAGDTSKMSRSEYLSYQLDIKRQEDRLASLKSKLNTLNDNATKAGVPAEFK